MDQEEQDRLEWKKQVQDLLDSRNREVEKFEEENRNLQGEIVKLKEIIS